MTNDELKRLLDDAFMYDVCADSLKNLNDNKTLDELTEKVMRLRTTINKIDNRGIRMCMTLRYVNKYSFTKIAKKMKVSYQWINKLHTKGVDELLKIYNKG